MKIVEPQKYNPSIKVMGKERLKKDSDGLREPPETAGVHVPMYTTTDWHVIELGVLPLPLTKTKSCTGRAACWLHGCRVQYRATQCIC